MSEIIRIPNTSAEFVGGTGEYLYKKVLEDIPNAKMVRVLTYNTEKDEDSELYNTLYKMKYDVDFKWIFNFISRKSDEPQKAKYFDSRKFENDFEIYKHIYDSAKFECRVDLVINCKNHAKMIGTENILYVGSQNFSKASKKNYELGFIVRDKNQIQDIYSFFEKIYYADESIPYYADTVVGEKHTEVLVKLTNVISAIEDIYAWNDPEYYDTLDVCKSVKRWKKTLDSILDLMNDIDEVIEECTYYDVFAEAHGLLCDLHEEIKDDSDIEYLLEFDFVDRQDEETENYENRYEDWIAERDKDIIDEFNSVYDEFIGKEYLERTQEVFAKLKSIHKQIGMDPDFEKNLNNSN